ncbi:MAG: hypothetical protein COT39_02270 [Parcubacteria group bacterium CG08_land_8_20_14_0_20_48_21]|nr:MAG: hypothetical protein AUK21_01525 [Parcubacteria group bacterium CG2_30_48_51]PIS32891.1 MAG: hypothetical protein COT39_02270 [Parcubacteria group bacterium CG08_land_8_20_14_0_20_48_21]PIW78771.1 MAG: hypothetical protein COZ99_04480 [Parcubacteria group bacterium CG_4_8_14_3_um_filter_48_16]PIY78260.1 MAG: hypothetical protein COY83_00910 [Parcubacteria group bacterium CG_4_10_14_0_8_um_filter_48_154]PIZ77611.1 MAG: hypothetical protein COY03_02295 [bacterium CG_4_10_14_0_2_um_filter_
MIPTAVYEGVEHEPLSDPLDGESEFLFGQESTTLFNNLPVATKQNIEKYAGKYIQGWDNRNPQWRYQYAVIFSPLHVEKTVKDLQGEEKEINGDTIAMHFVTSGAAKRFRDAYDVYRESKHEEEHHTQ